MCALLAKQPRAKARQESLPGPPLSRLPNTMTGWVPGALLPRGPNLQGPLGVDKSLRTSKGGFAHFKPLSFLTLPPFS